MKVLHVINGDLYAGAERVQDLLALRLKDVGIEVSFACIKPGQFPRQRMAVDAPMYEVPMSSKFDLVCGMKIADIVKKHKYDLVHTHTPRAAMVGRVASFIAGVPMVHHVHSPTARDTESRLRNKINSLIERVSLLGVRKLIPVSESLRRYLLSLGYDDERITVVPNGVPVPGDLIEIERPEGEWVVGTVALFRPRKGLEVLIKALAEAKEKGCSLRLRAVGEFETQEYENTIKSLSDELDLESSIDWVGFTRDVNKELSAMHLFVLPSLFGEGMPMVILEAMGMGVPVIASDVEGIPEVITDGETGIIVKPDDPIDLAKAIMSFVNGGSDWSTCRQMAHELQKNQFSDASMADRVADIYKQII